MYKYLLPFGCPSFHLVDDFLCCAEVFYFDVVPLVYSCFGFPCLRKHFWKDIAKRLKSKCVLLMFPSRNFMAYS